MAKAVNAGQVKRADLMLVFPEEIIVKLEENGRHFLPDITGLINDILVRGVLQPVRVRRVADNRLQLVAGYCRHAAVSYINANKLTPEPMRLPCVIGEANQEQALIQNITENRQRNNTSSVDDAFNIQRLKDLYGKTDEEICKLYAKNGKPMSPAWLTQRLKLLSLSADIQKKIHDESYSDDIGYFLATKVAEEDVPGVVELAEQTAAEREADSQQELPIEEEPDGADVALSSATYAEEQAETPTVEPTATDAADTDQPVAPPPAPKPPKKKKKAAAKPTGKKPKVTITDVVKAARTKGALLKQTTRKMVDVRELLTEWKDSPSYPKSQRKFASLFLEWIDGADDAALDKGSAKCFKE